MTTSLAIPLDQTAWHNLTADEACGRLEVDPARITEMVRRTRQAPGYRTMPILFNEDDHFDFDQPRNNLLAALGEYCSWGYFDPGQSNYRDGYQSPPVRWDLNTDRKRAFFSKVREITGN